MPSKGNYLRQVSPLATGGEDDPFARHVLPLFDRAAEIAIVAAFVQESGLDRIRLAVDAAVGRGARVRVITGDYLAITQADALVDMLLYCPDANEPRASSSDWIHGYTSWDDAGSAVGRDSSCAGSLA